jgi:hypothetical protein
MSSMSWLFANDTQPRPVDFGPRPLSLDAFATALRARRAVEEGERAERRRAQLASQRCDSNPPEARIRAWEELHGLRLPSDPGHPVLEVIAIATRLTLPQLQAEQFARQRERELRPGARDALSTV